MPRLKKTKYEETRVSDFEKQWEDKNFDIWRKRLYKTNNKDVYYSNIALAYEKLNNKEANRAPKN